MAKPVMRVTKTRSDIGTPLAATPRKPGVSPVKVLIIGLLVLGAAWGGKVAFKQYRKSQEAAALAREQAQERKRQAEAAERAREAAEIEAQNAERKRKAEEKAKRMAERKALREKKAEAARLSEDEQLEKDLVTAFAEAAAEEAARAKVKSTSEIMAEVQAVRLKALEEVARAQAEKPGKTPDSFAGIRMGEALTDVKPVRWGPILASGKAGESQGTACAIYGTAPKEGALAAFGTPPLVWLTPKTHRPYRVDFSRKLALKPGYYHDPLGTNVIASIKRPYEGKLFVLQPFYAKRPGVELAVVAGDATLIVEETDETLDVTFVREDLRKEAKAESDAMVAEQARSAAENEDDARIFSKRYPMGGVVKVMDVRVPRAKAGTPESFCGIVFGRAIKPLTPVTTTMSGGKAIYLDYLRDKCAPFLTFTRGSAEVDPWRGGVYAVKLFSDGGAEGENDATFSARVRSALTHAFKAEPKEEKTEAGDSILTYRAGDVTVTFAARSAGGFDLSAVHEPLAKVAETPLGGTRRKSR